MWSWTINLSRGTVTEEQIDERAVEFPRIDDRLIGLPARYGVTVGSGKLVRYDLAELSQLGLSRRFKCFGISRGW